MSDIELRIKQSDCYRLLAACFYEPEKELFIQEEVCGNLATLLSDCGFESAAIAAKNMQKAIEKNDLEEMKVEYAHLFIGPFELAAPPYGSVYLENKRMLMGDSTIAVKKMYNDAGLTLEIKEAPDHIALELEFMHYLITQEIQALSLGNTVAAKGHLETQAEFLERYLAPWVPQFAASIREGTKNRYYLALAECQEAFVTGCLVPGDIG